MGKAASKRKRAIRGPIETFATASGCGPQGERVGVSYFPAQAGAMNPYLRLLYEGLSEHGFELVPGAELTLAWLREWRRHVRVLHFHWGPDEHYVWDPWGGARTSPRVRRTMSRLRLQAFRMRLLAARRLGYRIVWTIHELYPPQCRAGRDIDRAGSRTLARASDLLLAHDEETAARARAELGECASKIEIVPHASYAGVYPDGASREEARTRLGIAADAFVFLCFGKLRRDKSIALLLDAFRACEAPNAVLIVAGLPEHADVAVAVGVAANYDRRIKPMLDFVPPEDVASLHAAADACVLARSETWTSGSLILALSLGVPVIAARLEYHERLTGGESAGWFFEPGDRASLCSVLAAVAADPAGAMAKRKGALARGRTLPRWPDVTKRTAELMRACVDGGEKTRS